MLHLKSNPDGTLAWFAPRHDWQNRPSFWDSADCHKYIWRLLETVRFDWDTSRDFAQEMQIAAWECEDRYPFAPAKMMRQAIRWKFLMLCKRGHDALSPRYRKHTIELWDEEQEEQAFYVPSALHDFSEVCDTPLAQKSRRYVAPVRPPAHKRKLFPPRHPPTPKVISHVSPPKKRGRCRWCGAAMGHTQLCVVLARRKQKSKM